MATQLQSLTQILEPDSLHPGSFGSEVISLQLALQELSLFDGHVDGCFGANTGSALRKLQREFGLAETGELDAETWYALSFWAEPAKPQALDSSQQGSCSPKWLTSLTKVFHFPNTADSQS